MKRFFSGLSTYGGGIMLRLFLFCLPITSFPYFPEEFGGGTLVRPLSVYPLIFLCLLVVLPRLMKPIPKTVL